MDHFLSFLRAMTGTPRSINKPVAGLSSNVTVSANLGLSTQTAWYALCGVAVEIFRTSLLDPFN